MREPSVPSPDRIKLIRKGVPLTFSQATTIDRLCSEAGQRIPFRYKLEPMDRGVMVVIGNSAYIIAKNGRIG